MDPISAFICVLLALCVVCWNFYAKNEEKEEEIQTIAREKTTYAGYSVSLWTQAIKWGIVIVLAFGLPAMGLLFLAVKSGGFQ